MKNISLDCNVFDKLDDDTETRKIIVALVNSGKIKISLSPTVYIELHNADAKNNTNLLNLFPFEVIDENTSFPPFIPGKVNIGGDLSRFNDLKGNTISPKKLKDPRIMDTLLENKISLFVTENSKDFKRCNDIKIIRYEEFKKYITKA